MNLWLSHPTGNTVVRALLAGASRAGMDYRFFSTLAFSNDERWIGSMPAKLGAELARRSYAVPRGRLERHPTREALRLLAEKILRRPLGEENPFSIDAVYRDLDRAMARRVQSERKSPDAVYAFEDGALDTFVAASQRGVRRVYDLPIAYWETSRRILAAEALRHPRWAPTLGSTSDSAEKLARKTAEIEQAEVVVCPSRFVYESIPERIRAAKNCLVAPFGAPRVAVRERAPNRKLRVLFAGALTQRKGLADLLAAARMLGSDQLELVLMGAARMPLSFYRAEFSNFVYEPPRSHAAVLELMGTCDLLALPSMVEGRAVVQHEALACGLPLLVTPNAGAEEMIIERQTGFLVPPGSPSAIAECLDWFLTHRARLPEMRVACRAKAAEYTWEAYFECVWRAMSTNLQPVLSA